MEKTCIDADGMLAKKGGIAASLAGENISCAGLLPGRSLFYDLVSISKPRIIALQLIMTSTAFALASPGSGSFSRCLWTLLGGALASASASALNCIFDRDIDALMERTKQRPLVNGRLGPRAAALYAFALLALSLALLVYKVNLLAAALTLAGHFFYVVIYTRWLKRSSAQNIVIGGVAGAVPPLVGWVAATGSVSVAAFLLFLLVLLWTPPHFWALAILRCEEYRRAGVPMLPVVAGTKATAAAMVFYALALLPVSVLIPVFSTRLTALSWLGLPLLTLLLVVEVFRLHMSPDGRERLAARRVFWSSLLYLAMFNLVLLLDLAVFV